MKLSELIRGLTVLETRGDMNVAVKSLTHDSRQAVPGALFVAVRGHQVDGHRFLPEVVRQGVAGLVVEQAISDPIPQVVVADARVALAQLASCFYQEPSRKLRVIGITGTNGKTTLTYLLESILQAAGRQVAVLGTINYRRSGKIIPAPNTTPDAADLQRHFRDMVAEGVTDVVMEVSSHALDQGRVFGVHFDVAAFTNLTQDHLDYHPSLDHYFASKLRLFTHHLATSAKPKRLAVVNGDDPRSAVIAKNYPGTTLTVGFGGTCDLRPSSYELRPEGILAQVLLGGKVLDLESPLIGTFNLENILLAVGIAHGLDISDEAILAGLKNLRGVPGRLERIDNQRGLQIFVDYAHTPDALTRVLQELRPLTKGRLLTVFGCGGDRDRSKRPLMGTAAARGSDQVIVTSDNPRTEDPNQVISEITQGMHGLGSFQVVPDREQALSTALQLAQSGDTLLVAGKGHEDYQIMGTQKVHFSDQEMLRKFL